MSAVNPTPQNPRTIAITGCGRGLGRVLAEALITTGHFVCGSTRNPETIEALRREFPHNAHFSTVDVSADESVEAWVRELCELNRIPDLLINNAGLIHQPVPLWKLRTDTFEDLLAVNVLGVHRVIRAFLPRMEANGGGVIANMSSGAGRHGYPKIAAYCATKWAVEGMSQALAAEAPEGITVVAVSPGAVNTDMLRQIWGDGATEARSPEAWVKAAAPFFLGLGPTHHGNAETVPS
jgi:NAD(P)-dependent dehydrogenase (short-subunit alcohol dehydrogenase family)